MTGTTIHQVLRGGLIAAVALTALAAQAQVPEHAHGYGGGAHPSERYDGRYSHNQYYPARGTYVSRPPRAPILISHPSGPYYYSGGVWYRPAGPRFVVVTAPVGVFVPLLPAVYTTLWVGGVPYYYANDTYYSWNPQQNGYEVADPPANEQAVTTQPPPNDDLFIYPQNGQSAEQQSNDKYECHTWAVGQAGFDPTQPGSGTPSDPAGDARANYQRAMSACLEGRGYSVR